MVAMLSLKRSASPSESRGDVLKVGLRGEERVLTGRKGFSGRFLGDGGSVVVDGIHGIPESSVRSSLVTEMSRDFEGSRLSRNMSGSRECLLLFPRQQNHPTVPA